MPVLKRLRTRRHSQFIRMFSFHGAYAVMSIITFSFCVHKDARKLCVSVCVLFLSASSTSHDTKRFEPGSGGPGQMEVRPAAESNIFYV